METKQDLKIVTLQGIHAKPSRAKPKRRQNPRGRRTQPKKPVVESTYLNPDNERLHRENIVLIQKVAASDLIIQEYKRTIAELENKVKVLEEKIIPEENNTDWEQGPLIKIQNLNDIEKAYMIIGEGKKINSRMKIICNELFKFKDKIFQTGELKRNSNSNGKTITTHLKILTKCGIIWRYKGLDGKFFFPDDPIEFMNSLK